MRNAPQQPLTEGELQELRSLLSDRQNDGHREVDKQKRPTFLDALGSPGMLALIGILGTLIAGVVQLRASRELEQEKLRSQLILKASEASDPNVRLKNLQFLVRARLIADPENAIANLKLEETPNFSGKQASRPVVDRELGSPRFKPASGKEGAVGLIRPDPAWELSNIVEVDVPQMASIPQGPRSGRLRFHRLAAPGLQRAFAEIESQGLLNRIKSWDGALNFRKLRATAVPSIHAYGIAFDINSAWNGLGRKPVPGQKGSVEELVPILKKHGFLWGGDWAVPEGGHFEFDVNRLVAKE